MVFRRNVSKSLGVLKLNNEPNYHDESSIFEEWEKLKQVLTQNVYNLSPAMLGIMEVVFYNGSLTTYNIFQNIFEWGDNKNGDTLADKLDEEIEIICSRLNTGIMGIASDEEATYDFMLNRFNPGKYQN